MNMDDFILTTSNALTPQTEILLYAAYLGHRPALFHSKIMTTNTTRSSCDTIHKKEITMQCN